MAKQKLLLDRYRVIKAVGAGGFATVYEALDTHLNRPVAIKVFELSESDTAGFHLATLDGKIAAELENTNAQSGSEGTNSNGRGIESITGIGDVVDNAGNADGNIIGSRNAIGSSNNHNAAIGNNSGNGSTVGNGNPDNTAMDSGAPDCSSRAPQHNGSFPSTPPADPAFLAAREERLAARNGATLRKKPNFEELAQAFEYELTQEQARVRITADAKSVHSTNSNDTNNDNNYSTNNDNNPTANALDIDNIVPWDEDDEEDLGPAEYFESEAQPTTSIGFSGPASLPIIGAAAAAHEAAATPATLEGGTITDILEVALAGSAPNMLDAPLKADNPAPGNSPTATTGAPAVIGAPATTSPDATATNSSLNSNDSEEAGEEGSAFDHIPAIVEARLIASLNDPNIVTVYDCQESNGQAYIIMEFVDGLTLAQFLDKIGDEITLDMVAAIVAAVTGALETAHAHNVLHLDIKPENVLIDRQGQVKVTDFGLATLADASGQGHATAGTIGYMPPEQLRSQPLDARTDEWAVASLTYELLTGTNQFIVDNLKDALPAIEDSELPVPSQMWDEAGDGLDDVVFMGLDIDPEDRYQTVEDFAQALLPQLGSVRKGKKQLAKAINTVEEEFQAPEEEPLPAGPVIPLVDKVGPHGAQLLVRILSALSCGGCAALAMLNFHALGLTSLGLATDAPFVFWPLLAAAVALAAIRPTFGALAAPLFLAVSFFANGAFLLALGFGALTVLWWVKWCKDDEAMALCALLGPATGAIGMGAVAPLLAGGLLSVGRAAVCAAYNAVFALVMACLGSCTLLGWNLAANSHFTINMQSVFVNVMQRPEIWVMAVAWVGAAALFSLFCAHGTRLFDVLGSVAASAVLLLAGWSCAHMATGFDPLSLAGCILPSALAVVLALLGVPDRARRDIDDWESLREL